MSRCLIILCSLLSASLTVSSACFAEPNGQVREVRYGDLDLSTPAGVRTLNNRIENAANQVCLDPTGPSPGATVDPTCKVQALQHGRSQIDRAIAEQRNGAPSVAIAIERFPSSPKKGGQ